MQPIHIIGVPLELGGNRRGTDMGPSALRIAGLSEQLTALGRTVVDKGDGLIWVDAHGDMNRPDTTDSGNVQLAALLGPEPAELAHIGGDLPRCGPNTPSTCATPRQSSAPSLRSPRWASKSCQ